MLVLLLSTILERMGKYTKFPWTKIEKYWAMKTLAEKLYSVFDFCVLIVAVVLNLSDSRNMVAMACSGRPYGWIYKHVTWRTQYSASWLSFQKQATENDLCGKLASGWNNAMCTTKSDHEMQYRWSTKPKQLVQSAHLSSPLTCKLEDVLVRTSIRLVVDKSKALHASQLSNTRCQSDDQQTKCVCLTTAWRLLTSNTVTDSSSTFVLNQLRLITQCHQSSLMTLRDQLSRYHLLLLSRHQQTNREGVSYKILSPWSDWTLLWNPHFVMYDVTLREMIAHWYTTQLSLNQVNRVTVIDGVNRSSIASSDTKVDNLAMLTPLQLVVQQSSHNLQGDRDLQQE